ncbi:ankyrin [Lepidopterella palustris CBS 459.81]|uniref:Ankyrin n=1 Tax=Lepidopterella palustris CBS 459.81 TaxID=1314670 RepID=A0A8E2EC19_9PEZI|nr:ankyrin [Lepidopterella palustris CBS 459.81]
MGTLIDVPRRLRRAILLNDVTLVRRIVHNNPTYLRNPDFSDKSNTSLHLAALHGFTAVAEFLIEAGHEDEGVSRNGDWETPLMLAAANGRAEVGVLLCKRFPECVGWGDKGGLDALMLSARTPHLSALLPSLLLACPTLPTHRDSAGNTALHHASAFGELKALRLLLHAGASPLAQNAYSWTPVHYSATSAAEAYFKNLVVEMERQRVERTQQEKRERERVGVGRGMRGIGGVRLVTSEEGMAEMGMRQQPPGALLGGARDDAGVVGLVGVAMRDWSPVERRRAMTPTAARSEGWFAGDGTRARASSGD